MVVTDTKAGPASVAVKGKARLQWSGDRAKQVFGSHLLQQDFQSPAKRAEGAVGGWCWQPVLQKTSPSTSQLFQACVLSPPTTHLSKIRQRGSILQGTGASQLVLAGPSFSTQVLPPFTGEACAPKASRSHREETGRRSSVECLHTLGKGGEPLCMERVGGSLCYQKAGSSAVSSRHCSA